MMFSLLVVLDADLPKIFGQSNGIFLVFIPPDCMPKSINGLLVFMDIHICLATSLNHHQICPTTIFSLPKKIKVQFSRDVGTKQNHPKTINIRTTMR